MRAMKLHTRMTLWYELCTGILLFAFCAALYLATDAEIDRMLRDKLELAVAQAVAQTEFEDGALIYEDETPLDADVLYRIAGEDGRELVAHGDALSLFDQTPFRESRFTELPDGGRWLLLDAAALARGGYPVRVRVAASFADKDCLMDVLRTLLLCGFAAMVLVAVLGGAWIARRELRPLRRVILCAKEISRSDLSLRVPEAGSRDELGELTTTLNDMLSSLEEAFRRERRFASDASHELRTPVAVILAYAENLRAQEGLGREQCEALDTLIGECWRMRHMIDQLLMLACGQEGRLAVKRISIPLEGILDGIRTALAEELQAREMRLDWKLPEGLEIVADESLATQLFLNLVKNAIRYGRKGGRISCAAGRTEDGTQIELCDDGIGIAPEHLPHIFERFYRVDGARDRSGTGLGLSIVKWIADAHGWRVDVESAPGVGTIFRLHLPPVQGTA